MGIIADRAEFSVFADLFHRLPPPLRERIRRTFSQMAHAELPERRAIITARMGEIRRRRSFGVLAHLRRPSVVAEQVALAHIATGAGVDLANARCATLSAPFTKFTLGRPAVAASWRMGSRHMMIPAGPSDPPLTQDPIAALRRFEPDVLFATPEILEWLSWRIVRRGIPLLSLRLILCRSGSLRPSLREHMAAMFLAPVIDYYCASERTVFAWSHRSGEYYFAPAFGAVGLRPVEDGAGDARWRISGMSLWDAAQPPEMRLTGDVALLPNDTSDELREKIALGLRPFLGIDGVDGIR